MQHVYSSVPLWWNCIFSATPATLPHLPHCHTRHTPATLPHTCHTATYAHTCHIATHLPHCHTHMNFRFDTNWLRGTVHLNSTILCEKISQKQSVWNHKNNPKLIITFSMQTKCNCNAFQLIWLHLGIVLLVSPNRNIFTPFSLILLSSIYFPSSNLSSSAAWLVPPKAMFKRSSHISSFILSRESALINNSQCAYNFCKHRNKWK